MGSRNFLVEGVSATGKTSVCTELARRGHHVVHGDRELAYQGDPVTGAPVAGASHEHHLWDVDAVRAIVADQSAAATFFCGGSRNFPPFIDLFDAVFVLHVDPATLHRRLDRRPEGEWGARPAERDLVVRLHRSGKDVPDGIAVDATMPLARVVDEILHIAAAAPEQPSASCVRFPAMDPTPPQSTEADRTGPPAAAPVLREGEPAAGPWREATVASLLALLERCAVPAGRPRVVAIAGRGGSGKTTLVARLARAAPRSAVVYTDDVAWHHSFFDWADLLLDGVLRPAREGQAVSYRPPAWDQRAREGAIEVPAATRWLFIEGTGAARRESYPLLDAIVWVQSDYHQAQRAGIARDVERGVDGDLEQATAFWHQWQGEERPFMDEHQPWQRADVVVAGVGLPRASQDRILIAPAPGGDLPHHL